MSQSKKNSENHILQDVKKIVRISLQQFCIVEIEENGSVTTFIVTHSQRIDLCQLPTIGEKIEKMALLQTLATFQCLDITG